MSQKCTPLKYILVCVNGIYHLQFENFTDWYSVSLDIRKLNRIAVCAIKSCMLILGGGVAKHHICNANLMVSTLRFIYSFLCSISDVFGLANC